MTKRGLTVFAFVCIFAIVIVLSTTFVSAGFFGDLWNKILGRDVQYSPFPSTPNESHLPEPYPPSCSEEDGGENYYEMGWLYACGGVGGSCFGV